MREHDLELMKAWFRVFCAAHALDDPEEQANLTLKEEHTHHVCTNVIGIAASLNFSPVDAMLAEATALFHDVGRFLQYVQYGTFRDDRSENHALLSLKALAENRVLEHLPERDRTVIETAVRFHNAYALPDLTDERQLLYLKLLRDADKIDILRVFLEASEGGANPSAIGLGLPETDEYSPDALDTIAQQKIFTLKQLRSLNDFRLLQLSWVFDLNFTESLRMLQRRNYVRRIAAHLPQTVAVTTAVDSIIRYMEERIANG